MYSRAARQPPDQERPEIVTTGFTPGGRGGAAGAGPGGGAAGRDPNGEDCPLGSAARAPVSNASRDIGRAVVFPLSTRSFRFVTYTRSSPAGAPAAGSMTRTRPREGAGTVSGLSVVANVPAGSAYVNSQRPPFKTSTVGGPPGAAGGAGGAAFRQAPTASKVQTTAAKTKRGDIEPGSGNSREARDMPRSLPAPRVSSVDGNQLFAVAPAE